MKTVTIPGAIYSSIADKYDDPDQCVGGSRLRWLGGRAASFGDHQLVREHPLTIELPDDWNPAEQQIAALREKRKQATAAYQAMVTEIDRQIAERLAIENGGAQ